VTIDRELVLGIAQLAHLELSDEEVELFARQLQDILQYIEKLNQAKQSAEPFTYGQFLPGLLRADVPLPSLPVEEGLKNAPERVQQFFKVPRIIP